MSEIINEIIVELKNVDKVFGGNRVVKDLNLQIMKGEFLTVLGPSGCGKTTTLRMIAGFEDTSGGTITLEGENVEDKPSFQRNVNTVFQNYALFPHMNVFENIAFGLREKKVAKNEINERVLDMLSLVQLNGFDKRMPSEMSGGQKQRVAIARALVNRPKVLLLDEPLGALDLKLRKQMQVELKHLQRRLGITFVYVTHDQEEALTMSDRIAIMSDGVLQQVGTPSEIYDHPVSKFVADFIGESNIIEASIDGIQGDAAVARFEAGFAPIPAKNFIQDEMVYVSIRPEKLKCSLEPVPGFDIKGVVKEHIYAGSIIKTIIALPNGQEIKTNALSGDSLLPVGQVVYSYWDKNGSVVMHTTEEALYNLIETIPQEVISR